MKKVKLSLHRSKVFSVFCSQGSFKVNLMYIFLLWMTKALHHRRKKRQVVLIVSRGIQERSNSIFIYMSFWLSGWREEAESYLPNKTGVMDLLETAYEDISKLVVQYIIGSIIQKPASWLSLASNILETDFHMWGTVF